MTTNQPRSENLLPADPETDQVAEEVNLDTQSDDSRRVGQAPSGAAGEALAESTKKKSR